MTRSEAGVSLVEILIVLAIIAVIASTAMIGSGGADRSGRADTAAGQFAVRLSLAVDEAITSGRAMRLVWTEDAYELGIWENPGDGAPTQAARYELPSSIRLSGEMPGKIMLRSDLASSGRWQFTGNRHAATVGFNGLTARVLADEE